MEEVPGAEQFGEEALEPGDGNRDDGLGELISVDFVFPAQEGKALLLPIWSMAPTTSCS
jgi:hypothetical protein